MIGMARALILLLIICGVIHLIAILLILFKIVDGFSYILGWLSGFLVGLLVLIIIMAVTIPEEAKKILETLFSKIL